MAVWETLNRIPLAQSGSQLQAVGNEPSGSTAGGEFLHYLRKGLLAS
jgi:hypothetical protein